jgi:hypothetical protein
MQTLIKDFVLIRKITNLGEKISVATGSLWLICGTRLLPRNNVRGENNSKVDSKNTISDLSQPF